MAAAAAGALVVVVSSFAVERRPTPLSPPAVTPGPFIPSQALLDALAALDARSRGDNPQPSPPSAPEFLSRALASGAKRASVFVARCRGCSGDDGADDCCGYLVSPSRSRGVLAARISALGVREACRRRGVATSLVRACAAAAAAAAASESDCQTPVVLTLSVAKNNAAARALYAHLRFKAARRREEGAQPGEEEAEEEEMESLFSVGAARDDAANTLP